MSQKQLDKDVLIVEDDEVSIIYLSEILTNENKTYEIARSGEEAIELIRDSGSYKLVLMDIGLPGINGYETTVEIKQLDPKIKVVAQTAYAFRGDREKCLEAGCDDYLTKPLMKNKMLEIIEKYL